MNKPKCDHVGTSGHACTYCGALHTRCERRTCGKDVCLEKNFQKIVNHSRGYEPRKPKEQSK